MSHLTNKAERPPKAPAIKQLRKATSVSYLSTTVSREKPEMKKQSEIHMRIVPKNIAGTECADVRLYLFAFLRSFLTSETF